MAEEKEKIKGKLKKRIDNIWLFMGKLKKLQIRYSGKRFDVEVKKANFFTRVIEQGY